MLPQQSSKPVRVCLDCYDSLSQTKTEQVGVSGTKNLNILYVYLLINVLRLQTKTGVNPKSNNNTTAADSSGEDDSDDDEEPKETHDEVSP